MGRVTRRQPVVRVGGLRPGSSVDTVAVEEPLEVRLDGRPFQVTMRTPGDDIDLVHGLLHSEQVITGAGQVVLARYCAGSGPDGVNTYNVLDVTLGEGAVPPEPGLQRNVLTSSACGVCGAASIDQVTRAARYALTSTTVSGEVLLAAPQLIRPLQPGFAKTGGLHAAALLDPDGTVRCVREDVGRHNAVDKAVGAVLLEPRAVPGVLVLSGRVGFEFVQKAVVSGIGLVVAVGAPSSLAVALAQETGVAVVGFTRPDRCVVYAGDQRVGV
jgi:FdhD protein